MTEYETDPQRRPADAEPVHPTAELPRAEHAQSPYAPDAAATSADRSGADASTVTPPAPDVPATGPAPAGAPTSSFASTAVPHEAPAPAGAPGSAPADVPGVAASGAPGSAPAPAPAGAPGPGTAGGPQGWRPADPTPPSAPPYPGHASAQPGHPSSGGPYPNTPWYPGNQGGWHAGHPGPSGPVPPGGPVPPWAQGPAPRPPAQPGRVAKFAAAGVAALALMFGSGVGGGVLALALFEDAGTKVTYSAAPVLNGADLPKIAAAVQDSVVSIQAGSGEGSGVILSADGFVLTNNHVVASAGRESVQVVFANGRRATAEVVGTDPRTDLAVVKATGVSGLQPAKLGDSDAMQVGDQVLALGSPLGLQGSVTAGIISARDRTIRAGSQQDPQAGSSSISGLLQTDAPINPGNSGGALVNTRGEVIGINTAIATSGQSSGNIGVGFAIPSNKAKLVAEQLQRGEDVSHPSLGVSVTGAEGGGALVSTVTPGSAAEKAGLRQGDVITKFGDKSIGDSNDLVAAVQAGKVGDRVEIEYRRDGATATVTATLAEAS
ncbi:trypsin-like peptidase domain-containing protein [Micromonospora echinospora]|uniref:trypsin-like peptidase domain-containing protein n=1 Tax=Micromonospora echinospora TaxID=1877 RepID=UPI0033EC4393